MEENILKKKVKNNKLIKMQLAVILIVIMFLLGISYAFFEFSRASQQDLLVVAGNIYMNITDQTIDDDRLMYPMESSQGIEKGVKYTFTLNGYNDTDETIHYGIYINRGADVSGKTRLKDSDIMMVLYENINGEKRKVYGPGSFESFNNTLIYANTIEGSMGEIEPIAYQYELIMWVSEKVLISDTVRLEGRSVYTQEEYANTYSNLKIMVEGDFEEKNTTNGEVVLTAKTKSDNINYITNLSYEKTPIVEDDVIVNFLINKELNRLVITNNTTNVSETVYPTKDGNAWVYQQEVNDSAKYSYYVQYSDGTNSDIYHYNVRIDQEPPTFDLSIAGRIKASGYNKTVTINNNITNLSNDIVELKYALVKKGEIPTNYKTITNYKNNYEIEEEVTSGIYELYVLAKDESGKEYTDHVTYEISYDLIVLNNINNETTSIEVIAGETINYLESLPEINIEGYEFEKFSSDKNGNSAITNTTVVSNNLDKIYAILKELTLYDTVEESLSTYLLPDDGDARIISGGGGYNDGNPIPDENLKNYVWYSGKLWRIVALNNDGSIKLVTQNNITTINWGSNGTYEGSWMYQWLNEDFLDTLYNYENLIVTDYLWNATETTATTKPAKTTMVEAAVGLLTAYEYTQSYNKVGTYDSGYLNNGYYWWLLTPYSSSYVHDVDNLGYLSNSGPDWASSGARPSINLSSNIKIKGNGDGSRGNPYMLAGDITKPTNNVTKLNERVSGEYLKFDNELYRIVNIENGITKITKTDYIREGGTVVNKYFSSTASFGSVNNETCIDGKITYSSYTRNCNEHWDYYLNNDWYNSISTSPINYKGMVVEGTWYLGQYPDNVSYKNTICADNNTTETTKNCTRTTAKYEGYVGLGRVGEPFTSQIGTGYNNSSYIWTITPYSSSFVRYVANYGYLGSSTPYSASNGGRPSINLSSNIIITDGLGTEDEPFEIAMG